MMVAGVVKSMSGESAERAALGAGSIVMDVLASNDGRKPHEKIERSRDEIGGVAGRGLPQQMAPVTPASSLQPASGGVSAGGRF